MDYESVANAITDKTKTIVEVDIAGIIADYDIVESKNEEIYHQYQLYRL